MDTPIPEPSAALRGSVSVAVRSILPIAAPSGFRASSVVVVFCRRRCARVDAAVKASGLANLVGLLGIGFIGRQQVYAWLLLGSAGARTASLREGDGQLR
jgi:hypothetical protein